MKAALIEFLNSQEHEKSDIVLVNSKIMFTIFKSNFDDHNLFLAGGSVDSDAGGWVISEFAANMRYCIDEKSAKIMKRFQNFGTWWLYLVDKSLLGFDGEDIVEGKKYINTTGSFEKVVLLSQDGKNVLFELSK